MKFLSIIVLLTVFSLTVCNPQTEKLRKFLTNFFQTVKGDSWKLSDACLAEETEIDVQKIITAIKNLDFGTAFNFLRELQNSIAATCPVDDLIAVSNEIEAAIKSGAIVRNGMKHILEILVVIKDESSKIADMDVGELGLFMGKLYRLLFTSQVRTVKFLSAESVQFNLQGKSSDFINGFIEATSDVPIEKNQCKAGAEKYIPDIGNALDAVIQAIANKTGVKDAFLNLMNSAMKLTDLEANCHFVALFTQFLSIDSPLTIAKIAYRITKNLLTIVKHVKDAVVASTQGDFRGVGSHAGVIFKIIFEYHNQ